MCLVVLSIFIKLATQYLSKFFWQHEDTFFFNKSARISFSSMAAAFIRVLLCLRKQKPDFSSENGVTTSLNAS